MSAVWMRVRAELRARRRASVGLALLVAVAGGVVLTAAPSLAVGLAIPGAILLANVIAAGPARIAARLRPAPVLRTE